MTNFSSPVERQNYHHLVMDVAWFGLAFSAYVRFLQVFAIRLGADAMDLGWLAALPAIVVMFGTSLSLWWRKRYSTSIQAVWVPSLGFRLIFILPLFTLLVPEQWRMVYLIASVLLPSVTQGIASTIFMVMMRESVSETSLTPLLARRQLAMNSMLMLSSLGFGMLLEHIAYPLNYALMFILAFLFSIVSQWHLGKIQPLNFDPEPIKNKVTRPMSAMLKDTRFQSVALITLASHIAFFSLTSVIPLHLERNLGASEGFFGQFGVVELLSAALVTFSVHRVVQRIGNRGAIVLGLIGTALAAVVIALAPTLWVTLIGAALTGASWSMTGVAVLGFFAERTDVDDFQATSGFHQVIFAAQFIGPLLGSFAASSPYFSLSLVLIAGAVLRLLMAVVAHFGMALFTGRRIAPVHPSTKIDIVTLQSESEAF